MQTCPSCTRVPLLILLTRHARWALRSCQQRQRSVRSASLPEDHPQVSRSDVPSGRATMFRRPGPLLCTHLLQVSQLNHRVQKLTRILRHLATESRRRPWPPPAVPGNLRGHGSPAPSPVGLALEIFCSHGTAGSSLAFNDDGIVIKSPTSVEEKMLHGLCQRVLGLEEHQFGVEDHIFEFGGSSMTAI